jgi:citrate synthase
MSEWKTSVSQQAEDTILIRGYPIESLIGELSYTAALFLTLRGELPNAEERRMLDAALCSILDYAKGPAPVTARVVVSANPQIGAAMAAGILAQGVYAVSPQDAGSFLEDLARRVKDGNSADGVARDAAKDAIANRRRLPGMGHPSAMKADPRAARLKQVALETGFWRERCILLEALNQHYAAASGRALVVNVDGMLGAVLGDMGFSGQEMAAIAALSMLPGIVANAVEEMKSGVKIRMIGDMDYIGPARRVLPSAGGQPAKK